MATLYNINYNITNGTISTGSPTYITTTAVAIIQPNTGYFIPTSIEVSGCDYSYDTDSGTISMSNPTSNVVVTATCTTETFTITSQITNLTFSPGIVESISSDETLTYTVSADDGYGLPQNLILTGASYEWDNNEGILSIMNPYSNIILIMEGIEGLSGLKGVSTPMQERNGLTSFNISYALSKAQVESCINELNTSTFLSNLSLLFNEPIENIVGLTLFPLNIQELSSAWIKQADEYVNIGNVTMKKTKGLKLNPISTPLITVGTIEIKPHYNSFLDYKPYTLIEMYLPYVGFVELDNNVVMGNTITIKYSVDIQSGKCTAYLLLNADTTNETLILQRQGQMGVNIQIGGGGSNKIAKELLGVGIGSVGDTVKLATNPNVDVIDKASMGANTTNQVINASQYHVARGRNTNPLNDFYAPQHVFVIYNRTNVQYPSTYANEIGKPLLSSRKLANVNGFTTVAKCHIEGSGFSEAIETEKKEIARLLQDGVIFPDDEIVNLTGTTWILNNSLNISGFEEASEFNLEISKGDDIYDRIVLYSTYIVLDNSTSTEETNYFYYSSSNESFTPSLNGEYVWVRAEEDTFEERTDDLCKFKITGGVDVTNTAVIEWFKANATIVK